MSLIILFLRIFLISLSVILSSCSPFVIGTTMGGAMGTAVASDRRCVSAIKDDSIIRYQAGLRLKSASALKNCRIVVATFDRVILLVGETPTEDQRALAEKLVKEIPHVKYVYNKIEIGQPITPLVQSKDAWITAKVISNMLVCADLNAAQIKVVTENQTVYLMGIVTEHQSYAAGEVARRVEGVQRVIKLFEK